MWFLRALFCWSRTFVSKCQIILFFDKADISSSSYILIYVYGYVSIQNVNLVKEFIESTLVFNKVKTYMLGDKAINK